MAKERVVFSAQQMTVLIEHIRIVDKTLKELHELRILEYCILRTLQLSGVAVGISDLVAYTGFSKSSITEVLLALEDRALIVKTEAPDDRRAMLVQETERGYILSKGASCSLYQLLKSTFWKNISEQEIAEVLMYSYRDHDLLIGERPCSLAAQERDEVPLTASFLLSIMLIIKEWSDLIRKASGLTMSEYRILSTLYDATTPLRLIDISDALLMRKSNTTNYKNLLEDKALIASDECADDKRSSVLTLTPKGKRLVKKLSALLDEKNRELYYTADKESNLFNAWHMRMYYELDSGAVDLQHFLRGIDQSASFELLNTPHLKQTKHPS